jgi:hypothetical protein
MSRVRGLILLALLVALLALPGMTEAAVDFCENDPIIMIGSTALNVLVAVPRDHILDVSGEVQIVAEIPRNAPPTAVIYVDERNFSQRVTLVESRTATWQPGGKNIVTVRMLVPSYGKSFPVKLRTESTGRQGSQLGQSNQWVQLTHRIESK